jgi:hypothetical protein
MALTKVSTGVVDMSGNTGGLVIAKGNGTDVSSGGERPTCNATILGSIRENTDENKVEVCTANGGTPLWQFLEEAGTSVPPLTVRYLIVAGGGGGGSGFDGGGGGAGGLLTSIAATPLPLTPNVIYTIEVGVGGTRTADSPGGNGGDSSINGSDITLISADGGGGGGGNTGGGSAGAAGGSGGGAGYGSSTTNFGAGTSGQGNNGGYGALNPGLYAAGGGGGGASAVGGNATITVSGNGGNGLQNNITGTNLYYAGGGGGGRDTRSSSYPNNGGGGGDGGGGSADPNGGTGDNGNNGVGGGGAGAGVPASVIIQLGGTGGSGVVILRYPSFYAITFQTGVGFISSTATLSATSEKVTTITAGSGTITFALTP